MYISETKLLKKTLHLWQNEPEIKTIMLFGCDKNRPSDLDLQDALSINQKPLMGGIFPEIIADGVRKEEGFVLIPLYETWEIVSFETSNKEPYLTTEIERWLENTSIETNSICCFVNALWEHKSLLIHTLYDALGPFVNYIGGGAGSLSFQSFPCVFANQQIIEHGAVIGVMSKPISLGVAHGWHPISEPIKVTETKGNSIISLNWQPAFSIYQSQVEAHSNRKINEQNFFEIAKSYPLGLVRLDNEMIVRDPYAAENGILHIVDEVPEGEYIRIMHGNMDSLLEGAKNAVHQSEKNNETIDLAEKNYLCIDCISRVLFMQDDFTKELALLNKNQDINGILSIGEIANPINAPLELFNKTVVVAQWKKKN